MKTKNFLLIAIFCFALSPYCHAQKRVILTFAGTGTAGYSGDGGAATSANLKYPIDVAVDYHGNIYVVESGNNTVRRIDAAGIITTVAGNGILGYSGNGGPATTAQFFNPHGIAIDKNGALYICDDGNQVIRKVDAAGIITTYAGNGYISMSGGGYNGDGIPATDAEFNNPFHIALDTAGNLYIADLTNSRVRKVNTSGIISTVAGNGVLGYSGDGGPATDAQLGFPKAVAVDDSNNVYIGDENYCRLRRVNTSGVISTYAGNGTGGTGGDGGPAASATLRFPIAITFDYLGNMYFADDANFNIRKINTAGIITTIAGNDTLGYRGDGGDAMHAEFNQPAGIAVDSFGIIYIADGPNNRVRILDYAPSFVHGHEQSISVCQNAVSVGIDTALAVIDSDARQAETWSLVTAPLHGSAAISYTTAATGHVLIPAGLSYTPATGYIGTDTFKVKVTDGHVSDTSVIYISTTPCNTGVSQANKNDNAELTANPNPASGTFTVRLSAKDNEELHLVITNLLGQKVKELTGMTNTQITIAASFAQASIS